MIVIPSSEDYYILLAHTYRSGSFFKFSVAITSHGSTALSISSRKARYEVMIEILERLHEVKDMLVPCTQVKKSI